MSDPTGTPSHGTTGAGPPPRRHPAGAMDPVAVVRSKPYLSALLLAAIMGIPISAAAYGFLALVSDVQEIVVRRSSRRPVRRRRPSMVAHSLVGAVRAPGRPTIRYLPGNGGHSPAFGFKPLACPWTESSPASSSPP